MTQESTAAVATAPSVLLTDAAVHAVTRLSPAFVRVELASPAFADLGEDGFDTRFKVLLPGPTGELPAIPPAPEEFYEKWLATPDDVRSPMRTYTVRDIVRDGDEVRLVVDFVVHEDTGHGLGPACRWALAAKPGDVIQVVAPHRLTEYGGTEFDPAGRQHLLLCGDETAVPALARILADLGPGYTGEVYVEVPSSADILDLPSRPGFEVTWFARDGRPGRASPRAGGTPPPRPAAVDGVRGPARAPERPGHRRLGDAALLGRRGGPRATSCRCGRSATTGRTPTPGSRASPGWSRRSAAAWSPSSGSSAPRSRSWATGARASR